VGNPTTELTNTMLITVAICTWNRAALLDQTLAEMRNLSVPEGVDWELLVVNNKCTDATDETIAKYSQSLPIRRLYEPEAGVSNARNCAVREARGEYIMWTDDDVLVAPNWMTAYVAAFHAFPDAAIFGGDIKPWFEGDSPAWLTDNWQVVKKRTAAIHLRPRLGKQRKSLAALRRDEPDSANARGWRAGPVGARRTGTALYSARTSNAGLPSPVLLWSRSKHGLGRSAKRRAATAREAPLRLEDGHRFGSALSMEPTAGTKNPLRAALVFREWRLGPAARPEIWRNGRSAPGDDYITRKNMRGSWPVYLAAFRGHTIVQTPLSSSHEACRQQRSRPDERSFGEHRPADV